MSLNFFRSLLLPFSLLALVGLSACETAEGFGEDVENLGENIQEGAQ